MNRDQLEEIQELNDENYIIDYVNENLKKTLHESAKKKEEDASEFFIEENFKKYYLEFSEKRWIVIFHLNEHSSSLKLANYLKKNNWKNKIQGVWTYLTYGEENVLSGLTDNIKKIGMDNFTYLEIVSSNGCILKKVFK
jgi:diphthamide synthase subunit DPH2